MPPGTVVLVRAALCHLLAGAVLGSVLLAAKAGGPLPAAMGRTWPLHAEMMLVGWAVQLAVGVAYWILPKHPRAPVRGPAWPIVGTALLLNLGVALAGTGLVLGLETLTVTGRVAEAAAVALFAGVSWPRVKAFGR